MTDAYRLAIAQGCIHDHDVHDYEDGHSDNCPRCQRLDREWREEVSRQAADRDYPDELGHTRRNN